MNKSQEVGLVALIFLVGFLTLYYFSGYILDFQGSDAAIYGDVARNIIEKNSMESDFIWAAWQTFRSLGALPQIIVWRDRPIYVYVVALFFRIFGSSFWTMKLVNVTFGSLLVIPVFYLTKALFGRRKAIVASVISFLYPLLIIGSIVPGDKIFDAFIVASVFCFLVQDAKLKHVLLSGIFCGLAFLVRYDLGGALFASTFIFYSLGAHFEGQPFKKRLVTVGIFVIAFAFAIFPWLIRNYIVFGYSLVMTGVAARTFTRSDAFFLSPQFLLVGLGVLSVIGFILSSLALKIVPFIRGYFPKGKNVTVTLIVGICAIAAVVLLFKREWLIFGLSIVSTYPQFIYQSSPFIFIFALVGAVESIRKIGLLHPIFTYPIFTVLLYTILYGPGLGATYAIPYIPLAITFATSAVFDVSSSLFMNSFRSDLSRLPKWASKLELLWSPKYLMVIFFIGTIFLSFVPQYAIITQAENVQQGPFLVGNWDKAYNWISANTDRNATIMARSPPITFYTARRTIILEPVNVTQLFSLIKVASVSYLIIDSTAYSEAQRVPNSMIAWLHDYPQSFSGFNLVYQVESPRLQIFDVRGAPSEQLALIGWSDYNFTSGWTVDPRLTFASDGDFVEMAYDNTHGSSTVSLEASKTLPSPIDFSEYRFIIIQYKFKYWTTPGYPPPQYFRGFMTSSTGMEFASDKAPYPADDEDYGWHSFLWSPIQAGDIAKITLLIRVGAGTRFSVVIDYIVISKWPIYIGG